MSAKIDPTATDTLSIDCPCEGTPHESDTVTLRSEYGYGDLTDIQAGSLRMVPAADGRSVVTISDPELEHYALLKVAITAWTFLEDDGSPMEVSAENIRALHNDIGNAIGARANALYLAALQKRQLPNGSSGPSQPSSPEMPPASTNRAQRRAAKRSTPRSSSAPAGPTSS